MKTINRKGNETPITYRNASSILNQSPQDKSKVNQAQNREEGGKNYKVKE
jgi:hypothetical protein